MNVSLPQIRHDQDGFETIVRLWAQTKTCVFEDIDIDMSAADWFDADMCAPFGAILYHLGQNLNTVNLPKISPDVEKILSKNGFLSHYGHVRIPDVWGTTIPYQRFDVKDDRYFAGYIEAEFVNRAEIPTMSPRLIKKFRESIFEIFSNAVMHSRTQLGIFSCGQFYPRKNRLDFCVADLGVGIRQNIFDTLGQNLAPEEAIKWATFGRNTTKQGPIPGGLGLKLLAEFIDLNQGCIHIVSDAGYWGRTKGSVITARLSHPFPGTVVGIEINTADSQSYMLSSELSETNIF
jgi:hypothetical protein